MRVSARFTVRRLLWLPVLLASVVVLSAPAPRPQAAGPQMLVPPRPPIVLPTAAPARLDIAAWGAGGRPGVYVALVRNLGGASSPPARFVALLDDKPILDTSVGAVSGGGQVSIGVALPNSTPPGPHLLSGRLARPLHMAAMVAPPIRRDTTIVVPEPQAPPVVVPDLHGLTLNEARTRLASVDLMLAPVSPAGRKGKDEYVSGQKPQAGDSVARGTPVTVTLRPAGSPVVPPKPNPIPHDGGATTAVAVVVILAAAAGVAVVARRVWPPKPITAVTLDPASRAFAARVVSGRRPAKVLELRPETHAVEIRLRPGPGGTPPEETRP